MTEDRVMLSARVPEELKELVDADQRANQEIVEAALWREFGGKRKAAIERRVEEKKRRISTLESERNERDREIATERQELEALESQLEAVEEQGPELTDDHKQKIRMVPREPDHPVVENVAEEVNMTPENVLTEVYDFSDGDDE